MASLAESFRGDDDHSDSDVHTSGSSGQLNQLRAAVLGANDGIVSVAAIVLGVVGATSNKGIIFTAGLAGLVAGALSMGVGEYVSVSTQRDTERAYIKHEAWEHRHRPKQELEELAGFFKAKGVSQATAKQVAKELTAHDALAAHLDVELNIDANDLTNPWQAATASLVSFTLGGLIPLLSVLLVPAHLRFIVTFAAVTLALLLTGFLSATAGGSSRRHAMLRVVTGGALAMIITFFIGRIFGHAIS